VQLAGGMGLRLLPVGDAWFYDRFRGWSENPNQAGFLAAVLAFMAMHVLQTAATSLGKLSALSCAAVAIGCGILTRSDSFMVALLIGASAWVAVTALAWLRTLRAGVMLRGAAVVLGLLSVPLAMTSFAPFGAAALERVGQTSEAMYAENDQGETRLELWSEALGRTVQSAFLGFGPGPQLTSKAHKRPPPSKFEAHNTFLDLLTQGGLLAVAAFLCICAAALRTAWRARLAGLVALLCALAAFSMFHLVLRQPIFWFAVVLSLLALPALPRAPGGASIRDRSGAMP
jgi:O-antigen ligase